MRSGFRLVMKPSGRYRCVRVFVGEAMAGVLTFESDEWATFAAALALGAAEMQDPPPVRVEQADPDPAKGWEARHG